MGWAWARAKPTFDVIIDTYELSLKPRVTTSPGHSPNSSSIITKAFEEVIRWNVLKTTYQARRRRYSNRGHCQ